MIIYKITNLINEKVYIGLTTVGLEYRWKRHITEMKNVNNTKHLYKSMRKYGLENFKIEIIAETENFCELGEMERKYIKEYDSTNPERGYNLTKGGEKNQYDGNTQAKVTYEDVVNIRTLYAENNIKCKDCWKLYSDKLSYSGFQKIWDGTTWKGIMDEVYTEANIDFHKHQTGLYGSDNIWSKYTENEVLEIRKFYVTHTLNETYKRFGAKSKSKCGFRVVIDKTYSNVPVYSKIKKKWFLRGEEINIDEYNPVSTIPVSGK